MIINARMLLHVQNATDGTNVKVHKVQQAYNPSSVTWNNQPVFIVSQIADNSYCNGFPPYYNIWNITTLVKDWYKNGNYYGVLLKTNDNSVVDFYTFINNSKDLRPIIEITYMSKTGLEDYWTYHSLDLGRSGTAYVNDCSGNLIYSHSDLTMNGSRMPIDLTHYYNSTSNTDIGYGTGWRLSYNQKVTLITVQSPEGDDSQIYYVYTDGDGTNHYFSYDPSSGLYKDQSGLNITFKKNTDNTYTIKDKVNDMLNFNISGQLSSIIDNNGNSITIGYTGNLPTSITDGVGRITTLNYTDGKLTSIIDPNGRSTTFVYTGSQLSTISYNDSRSSTFGYDVDNKLNSVTGIDGRLISTTYYPSAAGAMLPAVSQVLIKNTDGTLGNQWDIVYGQNTTTFTDEIGRKYTYQFNDYGNTSCIIFPDYSAQYIKYINDNIPRGLYPEYSDPDTTMNKPGVTSKLQKTIINYLQNHNMELTSNIIWNANSTADSQGAASVTTENKHIGNQSLKISKTNNTGRHYYSQNVTNLTSGIPYTLSCYVKTSSISNVNNKGANLFVTYNLSGMQQIVKSAYINGTEDWQRIDVQFTLPQGYDAASLNINLGVEDETGTVYFDCAQLEPGYAVNRYNLIDNGGATSSISNYWTITVPSYITSGPSFLPTKAIHFMDNMNKVNNAYQVINISGNAGDVFVASSWSKANSSVQTGYYKVILTFNNQDGTATEINIPFNCQTNNWQFLSEKVTAEKAYSSIKYTVSYDYNATGADFTGMQLYKEGFGDSYSYDSNGNLTNVTDASNNQINLQYTNNDITNITDENNKSSNYTYDSKHNLTTGVSAEGINDSISYDSYGNILTLKTGDSATEYIKSTNTYSSDGNYLSTASNESGNNIIYNYNLTKGTLDSLTDAAGKTTSYTYDPNLDRLTDVTKSVAGNQITNHYTYNNDYLSQITHNGFSYNFNYDSLGNLTNILVGSQSIIQNTYEPRTSRLADSTYGNGQKISYTYDNMDRVTAKKFNDNIRAAYGYDSYGNLGYYNDLINGVSYRYFYDIRDQLTKIVDSSGNITSFDYDPAGNEKKIYDKINGYEYTTSYDYNGDNRQSQVTLNGGQTVDYNYDISTGRLFNIYTNTGAVQYTTSYTYKPNVNPSNGVTKLIKSISNGSDSPISYTYDANGNIETITQYGKTIRYYYNELNEVIREDNQVLNKTIAQSYDSGGNITAKTEYAYTAGILGTPIRSYAYTYDGTWKDKLTNYDGKEITYDQIGNPITYDGWTYTWEMGKQLANMSKAGQNLLFKYNDDGIRTEKTVNGVVTRYHLIGGLVAYQDDGTDRMHFTYDADGQLISMNLNGQEYYYIFNGQGDVIGLFDSTGVQVVSYTYDTWGKLVGVAGSLASTVGVKNSYRYRGYRYDTETGLYYLQSRYYNPEWGRFVNADSTDELDNSGELLSNNLFAYCSNNPINMVDANGHFAQAAAIGFGACFGPIGLAVGIVVAVGLTVAVAFKAKAAIDKAKSKQQREGPVGKAGRKGQGREVNEQKRKNDNWESRSNKNPNRPMKKHTSGRDHRVKKP